MNRFKALLFATFVTASASSAFAGSIPYANAGTVAPTVTTYATTNGINLYYYGSTAGYTDYIGVIDLKTGYNSGSLLNNKTTSVGTEITVGTGAGQINAGDQLEFYINSPEGDFYSIAANSPDGINHAYITNYSGGTANGVAIPAGYFVGLEDEAKNHSDLNYNDDDFILTGISNTSVTPEPASLVLMATGVLGVVVLFRRRAALQNI